MLPLIEVQNFLQRAGRGEIDSSRLETLIEQFGEDCKELAGQTVNGTLDVILDVDGEEEVWDIKTASPWSFENKFSGRGGYDVIKEDDPFGYVMQGHLYGESEKKRFGGWIVINKSTGEWDFVEAPEEQSEDRKAYLEDANKRVKAIVEDAPFKVPFQSEPEYVTIDRQKVETGNRLMPKTCSFCSFKEKCWKNAVYAPKATSKAKFKPHVWYTKLVKKDVA